MFILQWELLKLILYLEIGRDYCRPTQQTRIFWLAIGSLKVFQIPGERIDTYFIRNRDNLEVESREYVINTLDQSPFSSIFYLKSARELGARIGLSFNKKRRNSRSILRFMLRFTTRKPSNFISLCRFKVLLIQSQSVSVESSDYTLNTRHHTPECSAQRYIWHMLQRTHFTLYNRTTRYT